MTKCCRSCTSVSVIDFEWVSNANKTVKWYAVFDHAWRAWQKQMTYLSELQMTAEIEFLYVSIVSLIWSFSYFHTFSYIFEMWFGIRRRFVEFLLDAGPSWRRDRMSHRLVNGLFESKKNNSALQGDWMIESYCWIQLNDIFESYNSKFFLNSLQRSSQCFNVSSCHLLGVFATICLGFPACMLRSLKDSDPLSAELCGRGILCMPWLCDSVQWWIKLNYRAYHNLFVPVVWLVFIWINL